MNQPQLSALIVDDEPIARQRIRRLLARETDFRLIGDFASVAECETLDASVVPYLLLLDVRMPERNGFDLLASFEARGVHPFVIFVTAYAEYAVDAFGVEAVDYLLKPFDDDRFAKAIARARAMLEKERAPRDDASGARDGAAPQMPPPPRNRDRLLVNDGGRVLFVPAREIELVQAAGKHVKIFVSGHCYLARQALREVEARLDANHFVRVHRSTIINVEQIVELHPLFHGDCEIVLKRGTRVTLSRRFRSRILPFLVGPWPA
jgi:two-component system, LytTR family, response regulator